MSAKPEAEQDWFLKTRRKGPAPAGKATFILLRSLDVLLQYYLLRSNFGGRLIQRLGGTALAPSAPLALGLPPYQLLIWALSLGSAAKQIFWTARISDNVFEPGFAAAIAAYNTLLNTLNLLLSAWGATSNAPDGLLSGTVPVGVLLFALGIYLETVSEIQRSAFKHAPGNKDKPFSGGLFGYATNINYGGYTLWRAGYAVVCAGLPWGAVVAAWLAGDFCFRAIPLMEKYCQGRVSPALCFAWKGVAAGSGVDDVEKGELTFVRAVWRAVGAGKDEGAVSAAAVDLLMRMAVGCLVEGLDQLLAGCVDGGF
ncbi:hypothetical protein MMC17_007098 [Xylographa soralifera]|nr:hypothetical protein [Xylographa soralifera]